MILIACAFMAYNKKKTGQVGANVVPQEAQTELAETPNQKMQGSSAENPTTGATL
jgi:hypothetical protein